MISTISLILVPELAIAVSRALRSLVGGPDPRGRILRFSRIELKHGARRGSVASPRSMILSVGGQKE